METFQINIDQGISFGEKIIVSGAARDYPDKDSSDLVFIV